MQQSLLKPAPSISCHAARNAVPTPHVARCSRPTPCVSLGGRSQQLSAWRPFSSGFAPFRRALAAPPAAGYGVEPESEQRALQSTAALQKTLSFVAFWLQLALSISAAAVLLFAVGFTPRVVGSTSTAGTDLSKWLTLGSIVLAFISSFFAHGFLTLATKLQAGEAVSRAWIARTLITNNTLNLAGILATAVALQASVGTLVAKSLMSSAYGATPYQQGAGALVSIDVFGLQATTNSLLCHTVSLIFTNILLRLITPKVAGPA